MMLGVTSGRGNTRRRSSRLSRRIAAADGTHPRGTIYLLQNGDIRSRVRQAGFPDAVAQLKELGVAAEIIEGTLPQERTTCRGHARASPISIGRPPAARSCPGAICEHFTSFGGVMSTGAGQTPLSELLRYGAAAASGTVTEPYAIADNSPCR